MTSTSQKTAKTASRHPQLIRTNRKQPKKSSSQTTNTNKTTLPKTRTWTRSKTMLNPNRATGNSSKAETQPRNSNSHSNNHKSRNSIVYQQSKSTYQIHRLVSLTTVKQSVEKSSDVNPSQTQAHQVRFNKEPNPPDSH